jgi:hypothetical protein
VSQQTERSGFLKLILEDVKKQLEHIVDPGYTWPEIPVGWQLEFIAHSNTDVAMEFLHPVSGYFWSEDNEPLDPPVMINGNNITASALTKAGVPFMTTFHIAAISDKPPEPHLSIVKANV